MKRYDYIKFIYNSSVLNDVLVSLGAEELSQDERAALEEQLRKLQEENRKLEEEQEELEEPADPEELEDFEEDFEEPFEEEPSEEVTEEDLGEDVPEEDKIEMPGTLEKGQQEFTWIGTKSPVAGILKKYSPGATLAKECPTCGFQNRPIYITECKNCEAVYNRIKKHIAIQKRSDKEYTPEQAFEDLASKYRFLGPTALKKIYETEGKTPLEEINEIPPAPRKQLEDVLWYRLNVKRNPKTGEPYTDKMGRPIPLEKKKYFSTEEITETLHLSPESLREMVANYNAKIVSNLPEEAKARVKTDENGDVLPSSARELQQYGFVAPAVVMGTGMADVRTRITKDQEENLSPEQVEALKSPAFKSVDIAAWNWDKLKPVMGWNDQEKEFTHGWMKFLKEKFLPEQRRFTIQTKINSLKKVIDLYEKIAKSQREDVKALWNYPENKGLRVHTFFHYNPETSIEDFKNEWKDEYEEYKNNRWKIAQKNKIDKGVPKEVRETLENYDERKTAMEPEQRKIFVDALAARLKVSPEKIEEHLELRDEVNEMLFERPSEIEYMIFLESNPNVTKEQLEGKYESSRKAFEKFVWAKKEKAAEQFSQKADRLKDKLMELEEELKLEPELPEGFDLNEEVRKYHLGQTEDTSMDPDPKVEDDLKEAEKSVKTELSGPEAPNPLEMKASRMERILSLAINQLDMFEEKQEEEKQPPVSVEKVFGPQQFIEKPGTEYILEQEWFNEEQNERGKILKNIIWRGTKPLKDEILTQISEQEFEGLVTKEPIFVTLTDPLGGSKILKFELSPEETLIPRGVVGKVSLKFPSKEEEDDEDEIEPELNQQEKAENAPVENFGSAKGKYFVYFEWNPDSPSEPNSYKAFFSYSPGKKDVDFEELLKYKIEKRFGPKIISLMETPEDPEKIRRKYVHVTVIEPGTERRRRFGAVFNKNTGDFNWHGTGGVVVRKEKERRLNLDKYEKLKAEVNMGLTSLENIELVGDDDLKIVETETKQKYKSQQTSRKKDEMEYLRKLREERKSKLEKLTPEELEELEDQKRLKFAPNKEYQGPSEETIDESKNQIKKVVSERGLIKKKMLMPVIDPVTDKPKRDANGNVIKKEELVGIPKIDHYLITIRTGEEGKPLSAKCEKIGISYQETGEKISKITYPNLYKEVKKFIDKNKPELKKDDRWEDRKNIIEKEYKDAVEKLRGPNAEPYSSGRAKEPYLPAERENMSIKPCPSCPQAFAPFEKACDEMKAVLKSLEGEAIPKKYKIYDFDQIKRKEPRDSSQEKLEKRRIHDVTEFSANDRKAKLNKLIGKIANEYQGKKVKLNDPTRNPSGSKKKFTVYVKDNNGKVRKVQFGDPNMEIKRDDPKNRNSFRARHKCDQQKDKTTPAYWSCKQWRKDKKVND